MATDDAVLERPVIEIQAFEDIVDIRRPGAFSSTGPTDASEGSVLTFAEAPRYLQAAIQNSNVAAIVVPPALAHEALQSRLAVAVAVQAREAFFLVHNRIAADIFGRYSEPRIAESASVAPTARIMPGAIVGEGAEIRDFAFIGSGCEIGANGFVGEGAIVGADGHFQQRHAGRRMRVLHAGPVLVGAGAQILSGAIVQRDVFNFGTVLGVDAVLGPGVQVAHGVRIGDDSVLAGGSLVAGYTEIGRRVWIGPGATIGNKLKIGDDARIEIGSVVVSSVDNGQRVSGNFATSHTSNLRHWRTVGNPGK